MDRDGRHSNEPKHTQSTEVSQACQEHIMETFSSMDSAGKTGYAHVYVRMKMDPYFMAPTKINWKWIKDLNVSLKP